MERLEDTGRHVVHELERFLNTLGTIAGVVATARLLGTVTGIIRAFNAIQAGGMGDRARFRRHRRGADLYRRRSVRRDSRPGLLPLPAWQGRWHRVQMEKQAIRMADALEAARLRERASPAAAA